MLREREMMINKVITSYQNVDNMEKINSITDLSAFCIDNWVDFATFEENPILKQFISKEEFELLKSQKADFIVFRIDN